MRPRVYIFVNGILTFPGLSKNWNRRAVTWTHLHTPHKAESLEYLISVITRPLLEKYRARKLATKLAFYIEAGFEIVLVGHSNGCDVILDALRLMNWPRIHEVHLISAACDADFDRTGVNLALWVRAIQKLHLHTAPNDKALWLADTAIGRALGYGALGRSGPKNADEGNRSRIQEHRQPSFGHSTWFTPQHFEQTMKRITS